MGNEINKYEFGSTIEDEHIIFPGFSNNLSKPDDNQPNPNANKKVIDKEHITISKVFKATLDEEQSDKFTFLEEHLGILLSLNKEPKFRIANLDEIIRYLIADKSNPLDYLFDTYHRSITMIEIKFRKEYDKTYKQIHRIVANYISTLLTDPSLFNKSIGENEKYNSLKKYLDGCDLDELGFLLYDIGLGISSDEKALTTIYGMIFKYIHEDNKAKFKSFLSSNYKESLSKNMIILKSIFIAFPQIIKIYVDLSLKKKMKSGILFQKENYICKYIDVSPIEGELTNMRSVINLNKPKREADVIIDNYTNKLNNYLNEVADFLIVMYCKDPFYAIVDWAYELIKLNLDKIKLYSNRETLSTNGFLMNVIIIMNKIIFKEYECGIQNEENYSYFIFKMVGKIDSLFTLTDKYLPFSKFDRANPEIVNPLLKEANDNAPATFSIYTKLFFIQEIFIFLVIKNFMNTVEMFNN
jgi:hypothetical protein